jgi:hypothetical protein
MEKTPLCWKTTDATARSADVKKFHRGAILALLVSFGYLISLAVAQTTTAAPAAQPAGGGSRLALIDITRIFKTHARFKQMMEDMKRDVMAAENHVKSERDAINKLATEALPALNKGTQQYAEMEEQIANRQAKLAVEVNREKSESAFQRRASRRAAARQRVEFHQPAGRLVRSGLGHHRLRLAGRESPGGQSRHARSARRAGAKPLRRQSQVTVAARCPAPVKDGRPLGEGFLSTRHG